MGYVEFLRVRNAFVRFAIVLTIGIAFIALSISYGLHHTHGAFRSSDGSAGISATVGSSPGEPAPDGARVTIPRSLGDVDFRIPIGFVFGLCMYLAIGFASILGASLNKENGRDGFAFTKPISRERLALTFLAIDVGGIVAVFVYANLVALAAFAILGIAGKIVWDSNAFAIVGIGFGVAFMWYALLQAATAMRIANGGLIVGLSWAAFFLIALLYTINPFGPIFHGLMTALVVFDPLAYFGIIDHNDQVSVQALLGFAEPASFALTWGIAIVAFAGAIYGWKRIEV